MPRTYRIGEVAERTGLTVEALRYYERLGLLPRAPRTAGGVRRYDQRIVGRVRFIKQAQGMGLSLREIRQIGGDTEQRGRAACRRVRDMLAQHITAVEARIQELRELRRTLTDYLKRCESALSESTEPVCPTLDALGGRRS